MKNSIFAGGLTFAHLTGRLAPRAEASAPAKPDQTSEAGDAESTAAALVVAEKDDQTKQGDDGANTPAENAAAPDTTPKADDGDDDSDEEMRGKSAEAKARVRERMRCAAILGSPYAARNVPLACSLAFDTRLSRAEALAMLQAQPEPVKAEAPVVAPVALHPHRATYNPALGGGGEAQVTPAKAAEAGWDRAMSRARAR